MTIPGRPMPDNNTEYVKEAENTYNVQVKFVARAKLHMSVLVKGCEKEADKVQDATRFLCFHMCGSVSIYQKLLVFFNLICIYNILTSSLFLIF